MTQHTDKHGYQWSLTRPHQRATWTSVSDVVAYSRQATVDESQPGPTSSGPRTWCNWACWWESASCPTGSEFATNHIWPTGLNQSCPSRGNFRYMALVVQCHTLHDTTEDPSLSRSLWHSAPTSQHRDQVQWQDFAFREQSCVENIEFLSSVYSLNHKPHSAFMISFLFKRAIKLLQLLWDSKGAGCYQGDSCGRKYLPCSQHLQLLAGLLPVGNQCQASKLTNLMGIARKKLSPRPWLNESLNPLNLKPPLFNRICHKSQRLHRKLTKLAPSKTPVQLNTNTQHHAGIHTERRQTPAPEYICSK